MAANKYAGLPGEKQSVLDIEVTRLAAAGGEVPVVATVEANRIVVYWWNESTGAWDALQRKHDEIVRTGTDIQAPLHWNWSHRVGLAASSTDVYLVYRRSITPGGQSTLHPAELYVDRLRWNGNARQLSFVANPLPVSAAQFGYDSWGYHLWAGFDQSSSNLVILVQVVSVMSTTDPRIAGRYDIGSKIGPDIRFFDPRITSLGIPVDELIAAARESHTHSTRFHIGPIPAPTTTSYPHLVLLSTNLSTNQLDGAQWTIKEIDEGGWDLDAVLEAGKINCIYRRDPFWFSITDAQRIKPDSTASQTIGVSGDVGNDALYHPLFIRTINAATGVVDNTASRDDVPGGAHPRIQKINPLTLTVDRIESAKIVVVPAGSMEGDFSPRYALANLDSLRKVLLYPDAPGLPAVQWARLSLFSFSAAVAPRCLRNGSGWTGWERSAALSGNTVAVSMQHDLHPCWLLHVTDVAPPIGLDPKIKYALEVDVLHHRPELNAVVLSRYVIGVAASGIASDPTHQNILDINHRELTTSWEPSAIAECDAFGPPREWVFDIDNTLGGALTMPRLGTTLTFYSYTDLADGAVRIIYDGKIPPLQPVKFGKTMPAAAVTGTGSPLDEPVDWDISSWQKTELPNYEVRLNVDAMLIAVIVELFGGSFEFDALTPGALSSGLEALLDSLVKLSTTANPTVLDEDFFATMTAAISTFYPDVDLEEAVWRPFERLKPADQSVSFDLGHVALTIAKYRLEYFTTDEYAHDRVEITVMPTTETSYKGVKLPEGQGALDFRFDLKFFADRINVKALPGPNIVDIDSIDVALSYGRRFTPGLLVSDPRVIDPLTIGKSEGYMGDRYSTPKEQVEGISAALSAKPVGDSFLTVESVHAETSIKWTLGSVAQAALIAAALALFGLYLVESIILGLIIGIDVASAIPAPYGPIILAGLIITLTLVILFVAPVVFCWGIERRIGEELSKDRYRTELDKSALLTYAGEGLAEAIARKAIEKINSGNNPLPWGLDRSGRKGENRFQEQFWQWIFVSGDGVHIRFRR